MQDQSYHAFLSYSHKADRVFARRFQLSLQRFATPFYALRSLRVFRDESNLSADPDLWGTIEKALDKSSYFLLFASPGSALSPWVTREVRQFVQRTDFYTTVADDKAGVNAASDGFSRLCVILADGALPWTDGIAPEDPCCAIAPETAALFAARGAEPLVVDLRPYRHRSFLRNAFSDSYRGCLAAVASRITGKNKDMLYGDHLRQQRLLLGVLGMMMLAVLVASVAGVQQAFQRRLAENEARHTQAREFRGMAETAQENGDFSAALVQLAQGHVIQESEVPLNELVQAKARLHREIWRTPLPFAGLSGRFEIAAGGRLLLGLAEGECLLWDVQTGQPLTRSGKLQNIPTNVALTEDCLTVYAGCTGGHVQRWDMATGRLQPSWKAADELPEHLLPLPGGGLCVVGDRVQVRFWSAPGKMMAEHTLPLVSDDWILRRVGDSVLAVEPGGTYRRWEAATGKQIGQADRREPSETGACAVDRQGRLAARVLRADDDGDKTVEIWEIESGKVVDRVKAALISNTMVFDESGEHIILARFMGEAFLRHRIGQSPEAWPADGRPQGMVDQMTLLKDGRTLLVSALTDAPMHKDRDTGTFGGRQRSLRLHDLAMAQPLRDFATHDLAVFALAYSPDGTLIASGGKDCLVHLWDAASGGEARVLRGHSENVRCLAFSPDGKMLASGSTDGTVRLWDVAAGAELQVLRGHVGGVHCLAFNSSGTCLASGDGWGSLKAEASPDWSIHLWQMPGGTPLGTLAGGHRDNVTSVCFSGDGTTLLSAGMDDAVLLWNLETRQLSPSSMAVRTITRPRRDKRQFSSAMATFLPNGRGILAGFADGHVELRDPQYESLLRAFPAHSSAVTALTTSPDGKHVISGSGLLRGALGMGVFEAAEDDTLRICDVDTGRELLRLPSRSGGITTLALSPDGRRAAVAGEDMVLRLVALDDGYERLRHEVPVGVENFAALCPEGPLLLTSQERQRTPEELEEPGSVYPEDVPRNAEAGSWFLTDLAQGSRREIKPGAEGIGFSQKAAALSPDGKMLVLPVHGPDVHTHVWVEDLRENKGRLFPVPSGFFGESSFSRDGSRLALDHASGFTVFDVTTGKPLWQWDMGKEPGKYDRRDLGLSSDLTELLLADGNGGLEIENTQTGKIRWQVHTPEASPITVATQSRDGRLLAASGMDARLWLWEVGKDEPRQVSPLRVPVSSLAMNDDGTLLASGHYNGSVSLWWLPSGERLAELRGHRNMILDLAFDSLGGRLTSHDLDDVTVSWDVAEARADFEALSCLSSTERLEWAQALTHLKASGREVRRQTLPHTNHAAIPQRWTGADGRPPAVLAAPLPAWLEAPVITHAHTPKVQAILLADEAREYACTNQWAEKWRRASGGGGKTLGPDTEKRDTATAHRRLEDLLRSGRWADAETAARKLLQDDSEDAEAGVALAEAQFAMNSPEAAVSARTALRSLPPYARTSADRILQQRARRALGEALFRAGDYFQAREELEPLLHDDAAEPAYASTLLLSMLFTGDYASAVSAGDRLQRKLDPRHHAHVLEAIRPHRERARLLHDIQQHSPRLPVLVIAGLAPLPPSMTAPLQVGDIILEIDGVEHECPTTKLWNDLAFRSSLPNDAGIHFTLWRKGQVLEAHTHLPLQYIQADIAISHAEPLVRLGLVMEGGQAQRAGLKLGDVLWSANGVRLKSIDQLNEFTRETDPYDLVVRRYVYDLAGGFVMRRADSGTTELTATGEPRWTYEEQTLRLQPGPLGVAPGLLHLTLPVRRTASSRGSSGR